MTFQSESEIAELVRGFESCAISHRNHVAVAVWYLFQDSEQAANLMRASLHRFLDHYDCRKNYHETLTQFWILLVQRTLKTLPANTALLEATNRVVASLDDSRIAFQFYSKELVDSPAAREGWIEPDLKPL
jgi:hypothetical protein